jgi:protein dispatched 1
MQSVLNFGTPLSFNGTRFLSAADRVKEQEDIVFEFQRQVNSLIDDLNLGLGNTVYDFEVMAVSNSLTNFEFREQATKDTYWAGASLLFVLVYFILHMRSLILACYCIILIVFSFAVT